jgi:hypothetical protein
MEYILESKTITRALKYHDYWIDYGAPATVQDLMNLCQDCITKMIHTPTPELLAELDAWERGVPITASSKLLCQALTEGFEDLVENLVKRTTVTEQCFETVIRHFNENIARLLLDNMGEITDNMLRYLTNPQLVALAIPYINNVDRERAVLACESGNLRMLAEYGFDVRSPKVFSAVLARYEEDIEPLRFLATVSTATPEELSELKHCRESEWYWKCQATEEEKDALLASLKSNLRSRVAILLSANDVIEVGHSWGSFGQAEVDELPILPAWLTLKVLNRVRCQNWKRPVWRNGEVEKAIIAAVDGVSDFYAHELCYWWGFISG